MKSVLMACGLAAGVFASSASAALYSQANDLATDWAFFSVGGPNQFFNQRMADNFSLSSAATVTSVRWFGASQNFAFPDLTNFTGFSVRIYGDSDGIPDESNILFDSSPTLAGLTITSTGFNNIGGGTQYQFDLNVGSLNLGAGNYWFSVGGLLVNNFGDTFVWSRSTQGDLNNASFFYPNSGWSAFTGNDLAFAIIPAPSVLGLAGIAAFGAARRRR
jgi:hypothetical protein